MTITQLLHDFCSPPRDFEIVLCVRDLFNGTCYSNFQEMGPQNQDALVRKIMTVAMMAGLFAFLFFKPHDILKVILITSSLFFAIETSNYGHLTVNFNELRNFVNRHS